MKIVIFSHSSGKYGAELALLEMVDVLRKHHECYIFVPNEGPLIKEFEKINVKVEISKYTTWARRKGGAKYKIPLIFIVNVIYSIYSTFKVKKYKPDIIFSNTLTINTGMVSAYLLGLPHIWFINEFMKEDHRLYFDIGEKTAMKLVNKYSNFAVVHSKALFEKYINFIDKKKLKLIYLQNISKPPQQETSSWPMPSEEHDFKLIIIGSITESKGQILAIEALHKIDKKYISKLKLVIVGTGDESYINKLKKKILEYNLTNQVIFLGYINNPYPIIMGADSLLMLSDFEAFGRVTIMGMYCGKAIIASNSGSAAEIINDGENGLLFKRGDVSDLVSKIEYIYKNKELIKILGENARKFSSNFNNPDKYYLELNELIQQIHSWKK